MANNSQVAEKTPAQAVAHLSSVCKETPTTAVVLGSGVSVLEGLVDQVVVSFQDAFGLSPGVVGHSGSITVGRLTTESKNTVAVLRGRFHYMRATAGMPSLYALVL